MQLVGGLGLVVLPPARAFVVLGPGSSSKSRSCRHRCAVGAQCRIVDPWKTLGLEPSADDKQVKKAYRKLALRHHPDVDPSEEAHVKFMAIQEAYELVTGKRRGKESTGHTAGRSWDFHDWYWSFRANRRRKGSAEQAQAQTRQAAPEQHVNHQLAGLKRHGTQRAKRASYKGAVAAAAVTAAAHAPGVNMAASTQPAASPAAAAAATHVGPLHFTEMAAPVTTPLHASLHHNSDSAVHHSMPEAVGSAETDWQAHTCDSAAGPNEVASTLDTPSVPRAPLHHVHVMLHQISVSHRCLADEVSAHVAAAVARAFPLDGKAGLLWAENRQAFWRFPSTNIPMRPLLVHLRGALAIRMRQGLIAMLRTAQSSNGEAAQPGGSRTGMSAFHQDAANAASVQQFQRQYSFGAVASAQVAEDLRDAQPEYETAYTGSRPNVATEEHRSRVATQLSGLRRKAKLKGSSM